MKAILVIVGWLLWTAIVVICSQIVYNLKPINGFESMPESYRIILYIGNTVGTGFAILLVQLIRLRFQPYHERARSEQSHSLCNCIEALLDVGTGILFTISLYVNGVPQWHALFYAGGVALFSTWLHHIHKVGARGVLVQLGSILPSADAIVETAGSRSSGRANYASAVPAMSADDFQTVPLEGFINATKHGVSNIAKVMGE